MKLTDLKYKTALVTGGASGMGKVMALRLFQYGAKVAVLDTNYAQLQQLATDYPGISIFNCDVTDTAAITSTVDAIETTLGPITFLLHGAAIMPGGALRDMSAAHIRKVMHINYFGTVETVHAVLPRMQARNTGAIVVFGSIVGEVPVIKFGAYGATKAATNYFMRVLMDEHRHSGIQFLLVCPPAVNTPLIDQAADKGPGQLREMKAGLRKMLPPEAVIDAIEKALSRGQKVLYPGEANLMHRAYRLIPAFVRYIMLKTN
ncbi:MAG: SDR family oxidoreductase [Saprospiraceae bacterium]|nr:SDR family oxidoreductase [Saprospiraceae bacterium]MDP4820888.1 SDR family oxidoreductase [Saprospiraceae bacterium]MDP4999514.1 SDR family oxidoreductase [Saprospiraceae bacterium]